MGSAASQVALLLDLHGCLDGFEITFCDRVIARYRTFTNAARAFSRVKEALLAAEAAPLGELLLSCKREAA